MFRRQRVSTTFILMYFLYVEYLQILSYPTDQLMKDTMNAQYMAANNEAELLRQQEAFINQNRMHIEKRRRSRDRSRERSVDRDRGRSYSPPNRRRPYDRDNRRPYNGPRDNRGRNETDQRGGQRRSASADRDASNKKPIEVKRNKSIDNSNR